MKKFLFIVPAILAGCLHTQVEPGPKVNFSYAKPNSLGMYDPRGTPAGTFYLWNIETNRLTRIGEVELKPGTASSPRKVNGDRMAAFGVEGLPLKDLSIVEANLGSQFKAEVNDSVRQQFSNYISALSNYVVARKAEDNATAEDMLELFRPKDSRYRTVVFVSEDRPDSATFRVGSIEGDDSAVAKFKVELPGQEIVTVSADAVTKAACGRPEGGTGERPVCFTDVVVLDPYIQQNGNINWKIDDSYSQTNLSRALRDL